MHPRIRAALAAATVFVASAAAAQSTASQPSRWYASIYGTFSSLSAQQMSESRPGAPTLSGKAKFGAGTGFGGALGRNFGPEYSAEIAWDYQSAPLKSIGGVAIKGDYASNIYWLNAYRRFASAQAWTPYIGAGIGYVQEIDIDVERGGVELEYSRSGTLGLQAIAGVNYALSPRWALMADAKWMRVSKGPNEATLAGSALPRVPKYTPLSLHIGAVYRF
jgi:outer membrane protein